MLSSYWQDANINISSQDLLAPLIKVQKVIKISLFLEYFPKYKLRSIF